MQSSANPSRVAQWSRRIVNLATAVAYTMAATVPATYGNTSIDRQPELVDSDQDAEGDEDDELYPTLTQSATVIPQENIGTPLTIGNGDEIIEASEREENDGGGVGEVHKPETNHRDDVADVDEDEDADADADEETEAIGAVKFPDGNAKSDSDDEDDDIDDPDVEFENESSDVKAGSDGESSEESEVDEEWEAESNDGEDADADALNPNNCM